MAKTTNGTYETISNADIDTAWQEAENKKWSAQHLVSHVWDGSAHVLTFSQRNPLR